jgi:thioesterase domain-containing protein/aryl carrier-like protein
MKPDIRSLPPAVQERLTTLLVQGGHLNHPLRLQAHVETDARPEEVLAALSRSLPAHMMPEQLVTSPALPRLPNGKLDRNALQSPASNRAAPPAEPAPPGAPNPVDVRETLRRIWADVLGIGEIHDGDDFVELGGDSLLSISVVARARKAGLDIVPSDLFDHPSLGALAARIAPPVPERPLAAVADGPLNLSSIGQDTSAQPIFLLNANRKMLDALNDQLKLSRTLHLITLHWDSGRVDGLGSIEALAQDLLRSVRQIQPEGPYAIGGFSIGAVAAHEIARILAAQGVAVTDLILIDPPENPALFAAAHNPHHRFEGTSAEAMTLPRRLRLGTVRLLARLCRYTGIPLPQKLKRIYAAATYFTAAKRYRIGKPAVPAIIVRRRTPSPTSMWATAQDLVDLHEIASSHAAFHRDPEIIRAWTGMLATSLDRQDRHSLSVRQNC